MRVPDALVSDEIYGRWRALHASLAVPTPLKASAGLGFKGFGLRV